jgi:hypothetical protein
MEEELNNLESPEATPAPKKKRSDKMASMTREQRKNYAFLDRVAT